MWEMDSSQTKPSGGTYVMEEFTVRLTSTHELDGWELVRSTLAMAALSAVCRGLTVSPEKDLGANGLTSGLRPAEGAGPPALSVGRKKSPGKDARVFIDANANCFSSRRLRGKARR